ncbi:MAG TPA: class I SAM-dependent methyltransferase [Vicinamibacterales bacterium]|nr:class I SAM-dependent methyltransferase [Vicinamibacterales bacterium]
MRRVDDATIRSTGAVRFTSEYHYAVFEYWRSAKVLRYLERGGVTSLGRVLDAGCGGGGMCVSFGEESPHVVGIDLADRFRDAGTRLAAERGVTSVSFAQADGAALPFADDTFDTVFSHAVIEHVKRPLAYLRELRRVARPGARVFLQTAPYLSPHGSHLPPLKVPIPLHLVMGRRLAFATSVWLARRAPGTLNVPPAGASFLTDARAGRRKIDDLYYKVTVRNLRQHIQDAGLRVIREDLYVSGTVRRLSPRLAATVPSMPLVRDILIGNMEYLLEA